MRIIDISKELFSTPVWPGDTEPTLTRSMDMARGDAYTQSDLSLGLHNSTHMDTPLHFVAGGKDTADMDLRHMVGPCQVVSLSGTVTAERIEALTITKPILLSKGKAEFLPETAEALQKKGVITLGVSESSPAYEYPMDQHVAYLSRDIYIIENLDIMGVPDGEYFLCAAPLKMKGAEASPVRAILIEA